MGDFFWSPNNGIDVSSRGKYPYKLFSPFAFSKDYRIPVPGSEELFANSVEGIWQGLKVINGRIAPEFFTGKPSKRSGKPQGHLFKGQIIQYIEARKKIYLPAYTYHSINHALPHAWPGLEKLVMKGDVFLHDTEKNGDINNPSKPLAHSAILVRILNVVKEAPLPKTSARGPDPHTSKFTYLHEQVAALLDYRSKLSPEDKNILDEIITFAYLFCPDPHKQNFALEMIKQSGIAEKVADRLDRYKPSTETEERYYRLRR